MTLDARRLKEDFPCLDQEIDDKPVVYLDNACMTVKPRCVMDAMNEYYNQYPGCAGRSVHSFANKVTEKMDEARMIVREFLNADDERECVFMKNTTEGINRISGGIGLEKGDRVLTTDKEHNSNLVPWHMQREWRGAVHQVVKTRDDNTFDIEAFKEMMGPDVKMVAMGHVANLDGVAIPAREIIEIAHDHGAMVMLDGAQSAPHQAVDVQDLDVDFFVFSVHKTVGPTGMGIMYGKMEYLKDLKPTTVGGETVQDTFLDHSVLRGPPYRCEAGLQDYGGIIGTGAALRYIMDVGRDSIHQWELHLNRIMTERLAGLDGFSIIGPRDPSLRTGIMSFNIADMLPSDIGTYLDEEYKVMVRAGRHCVHSWFNARGVDGSVRASVYLYNTEEDIKIFCDGVEELL